MKIITDLRICLISCPGVRLSSYKTEVYLRIEMFSCYAISSKLKPKFPLIFYEHFFFDKHFDCNTNSQLFELLSNEKLVIELINENNLIICKYESNVNQFLYPRRQLRPKYSQTSRSLLMGCTLLPIAPKLEFQTINTIIEDLEEYESNTESVRSESNSLESQSIESISDNSNENFNFY